MDTLTIEKNIVLNLIQLAADTGLPVSFCESDVNEIVSNPETSAADKLNTLRRVKGSLHEVLYAPPRK